MIHRILILAAHGSRAEQANQEVVSLAARLALRLESAFQGVRPAFLEIAAPSIPQALDAAVSDGATDIVVLPYFLAGGRHVTSDIPRLVAAKRREHAGVQIRLAPYLGTAPELEAVLAGLAGAA